MPLLFHKDHNRGPFSLWKWRQALFRLLLNGGNQIQSRNIIFRTNHTVYEAVGRMHVSAYFFLPQLRIIACTNTVITAIEVLNGSRNQHCSSERGSRLSIINYGNCVILRPTSHKGMYWQIIFHCVTGIFEAFLGLDNGGCFYCIFCSPGAWVNAVNSLLTHANLVIINLERVGQI